MQTNITPNLDTTNAQGIPPQTDEERQQIVPPDQPWSDSKAKEIASKDFQQAFQYRVQNYDKSFRKCDDVYMAVTKQKTWPGTQINRASVPIWMGVQQIESLLPHAIGALFADDYPFECMPKVGTSLQQAVAVRDLLRDQMEDLNPDVMNMTLREIVRRAYKSELIYGASPVEFGWVMKELRRLRYGRVMQPIHQIERHPITGEMIPITVGFKPTVASGVSSYQISRPKLNNVSVWDFVIDPDCQSHNPQEARFACTRQLLPINYLKEICNPEFGFNVPETDKEWEAIADKSKATMAEVSKSWAELGRGNYYNAATEKSADPGLKRVEVIRYWQKDRHVWLFGREHLAYNKPNELGVIPFLNSTYVDVPGRFYGLSLCDLIEGDVKLAQAIIEARIDELNLMIHPPIIRKLGVKVAASQRKLRPGVEWEAEDPSKDIQRMDMGNVTASAYTEVAALEQRVQKTTGVTDLAAMGGAATGGNSANRTATGVNAQTAATGTRIQYQVENIEDQFMQPMLKMLLLLNQKYLDPEKAVVINGPDGQPKNLDPLDILNADVRFKVKASEKLRIRRALASGGLAEVLQFVQASMQQLAMTGIKVKWETIGQLIADAIGLPANDMFAPMSPQEMQQFQQMMMMGDNVKLQMQRERLQAQDERQDSSDETKIILELVKHLLKAKAAPETILQAMGMMTPMKMLKAEDDAAQRPSGGGE